MSNHDNNKKGKIIIKSGSDDMRAFFDFCMDFMAEDELFEEDFNRTDELLNWCEDPEMVKIALIEFKNSKSR